MPNKTVSQEDVCKAWSEKIGRLDSVDLVEIETKDGEKQTQLLSKETGSITVAVDGTGPEVLQKLFDNAGVSSIDAGKAPIEATGEDSVRRYTSSGVLATPTQPEAMINDQEPVEVDNRKPVDRKENSEPVAPVTFQLSRKSEQLDGKGGVKEIDMPGTTVAGSPESNRTRESSRTETRTEQGERRTSSTNTKENQKG